jgi:hypothetical protein
VLIHKSSILFNLPLSVLEGNQLMLCFYLSIFFKFLLNFQDFLGQFCCLIHLRIEQNVFLSRSKHFFLARLNFTFRKRLNSPESGFFFIFVVLFDGLSDGSEEVVSVEEDVLNGKIYFEVLV